MMAQVLLAVVAVGAVVLLTFAVYSTRTHRVNYRSLATASPTTALRFKSLTSPRRHRIHELDTA
jgi:hypothetical protein